MKNNLEFFFPGSAIAFKTKQIFNHKLDYFWVLITCRKAVALDICLSSLSAWNPVKYSQRVLFIYDGCLCWGILGGENSRLDIHWFKRAHEGGVIYEHTHAFVRALGWLTSAGKCYVSTG